jgi:hypothetical protein
MFMLASLAAALLCAQARPSDDPPPPQPATAAQAAPAAEPNAPSKIVEITVYQGHGLVIREVTVPPGSGSAELVAGPLPPQTIENSLYTEGTEGIRVLSTRLRRRAVPDDTREEVRAKDALIASLEAQSRRLQKQLNVQVQDLQFMEKLESFTASSLSQLTSQGKLDSNALVSLSNYVIETRATTATSQVDLDDALRKAKDAIEFAKRERAELSAGSSRTELDAVIGLTRERDAAGTVRLGYLVSAANWSPHYRLRGGRDDQPVHLDSLAAVTQHTGEDWPDVAITLSTARPTLDAAPPELLPLEMHVAGNDSLGPLTTHDDHSRQIARALERLVDVPFAAETPLKDVIAFVRDQTKSATFPQGIPIYVDPSGLQEAEKTEGSPVTFSLQNVPLKTSLKLMLAQVDLAYLIQEGILKITYRYSRDMEDEFDDRVAARFGGGGMGGMGIGGGLAGMGGMGLSLEQLQASGASSLNESAAADQAEELEITENQNAPEPALERDSPSVTFPIAGRLTIPSRPDPQLLEVARTDLPAEYFAKAVPVLTTRVYRLAKLTNNSDSVLLPGEATVYIDGAFVGRMRLPLVAAGEPFIAGFGVDPQLQVSRRLARKERTIQGGNQIRSYQFRIGLRNYRPVPVKLQLWDRLPNPEGEAVSVSLGTTSAGLSADPIYLRTARMDNLLRWELDVPPKAVGDQTVYLDYDFRLEYARDLPQPHFLSRDLVETPISGAAIPAAMGGMGGFRSLHPSRE